MSLLESKPKLYGYWRSSATWRLRWAFELKKMEYDYVPVNLLKDEHLSAEHFKRSPAGTVPVVEFSGGVSLIESLPILSLLDKLLPQGYPLFPKDPVDCAKVGALCEIINSGTQPIQTPRVMKFYSEDQTKRNLWATHWIREGLKNYDRASKGLRGQFSFGDRVTAADLCLIPQVYNALRFQVNVSREFPDLNSIYERSFKTQECAKSAPEAQKDAVK